ncbi:dTDP-4-dehydrorhamnose 3,5-epimerase [Tsuneonella sp. YG55]|uniref:dTDP-4-dehydrorhamnose 3,5-epimerase n=1 Tax=Tsuneonella litorea TaxID=2976475 RepID=A0A9X3AKG2_9SPHN|nr:dTDP-4-dehydrorhamnose 3,5-epimerase [Tsuneonella litorea]MCT2557808.1 dTDP-4-dehydrorhamnose 3,5-epimerase [Tsuneonella litorea]
MEVIPTPLAGAAVIEPRVFGDERGFFFESWNASAFEAAGLPPSFVQDNHSRSQKGVLRGMHFQQPEAQGKLVRVVAGAVWDAIVDLRRSSPTFGQWYGLELTAKNKRMLWVPQGFAHGFLALADGTEFLYKCTTPYAPEHEHCLAWNDPAVGIDWPLDRLDDIAPQLSAKDQAGLSLSDVPTFDI